MGDPHPSLNRRLCPRDDEEIAARGLTARFVKDLQNAGYLSRVRASANLTLVDVDELDRYLDARTDPAVYGPLAVGDLDALDHVGLCRLAEQVDFRLWGEL